MSSGTRRTSLPSMRAAPTRRTLRAVAALDGHLIDVGLRSHIVAPASARVDVSFSGAVAAGLTSTAIGPAIVIQLPRHGGRYMGYGRSTATHRARSRSWTLSVSPLPPRRAISQPRSERTPRLRARSRAEPRPRAPRRGRDPWAKPAPAKYAADMGSAAQSRRSSSWSATTRTLLGAAIRSRRRRPRRRLRAAMAQASTYRNAVKRCSAIGAMVTLRLVERP